MTTPRLDLPQPNHPLTGIRRQGIVQDIANVPATCNVFIGGDTNTLVACTYADSYLPDVGDVVMILENQGDFFIIGSTNSQYFEQWDYNGFSVPNNSGTNVTPQNLVKLFSDTGSAWSGSTWTAPSDGVYSWSVVGHLGSATTRVIVQIKSGGGVVLYGLDQGGLPAQIYATVSGTRWYAAGQTIVVAMFQNTGGAQVLDAPSNVAVLKH